MKKILIAVLLLASTLSVAQSKDAQKLLEAVRNKFNKVSDYKVYASIKLDMDFIKVPDMKATIFFKQPDKMKVESDGFAMLPKQGLRFSPADLLKDDFTALYVKSDMIGNRKVDVVEAIPTSDSSNVILSTLWIDSDGLVIKKVETTTKKTGTTQIELDYDSYTYGLPSKIKISFSLGDINLPIPPQGQQNEDSDTNKKGKSRRGLPKGASLKGSVIMTYKDYQVNKGIPDSFFDEKDKEKKKEIN